MNVAVIEKREVISRTSHEYLQRCELARIFRGVFNVFFFVERAVPSLLALRSSSCNCVCFLSWDWVSLARSCCRSHELDFLVSNSSGIEMRYAATPTMNVD
jgi:hypothetical protein